MKWSDLPLPVYVGVGCVVSLCYECGTYQRTSLLFYHWSVTVCVCDRCAIDYVYRRVYVAGYTVTCQISCIII
jgi:hypothetical protein